MLREAFVYFVQRCTLLQHGFGGGIPCTVDDFNYYLLDLLLGCLSEDDLQESTLSFHHVVSKD